MDTSKIIRGVVSNGRYTVTAPIVKEDYGLYLKIEGVELPSTYEVDFSNSENNGTSVTMIGNADGVLIPRQFIDSGKDVFAFLYHVGANYGRTVYKFRIPNKVRPDRTDEEPTPEEQSVIDQTIAALNEAVETAEEKAEEANTSARSAKEDADRAEQARNDAQTAQGKAEEAQESAERAKDDAETSERNASESERKAKGYADTASEKADAITGLTAQATTLPDGSSATVSYDAETGIMSFGIPKGKDGTNGTDGDDGYSPTASVSKSGKTATITITDKNGTTSAQVSDGEDGATGATPNLTIGTVDTLEPTESATASITGTPENPVLNLGIPQGEQGEVTLEEFYKAFPTDTASGAIASFSDGADNLPLKSLVVDINPIQDLSHGDPSPENICPISGWDEVKVTRTGKNLLNPDISSWVLRGTAYRYINNVVPKGQTARLTFIDKDTSVSVSGISLGFVYNDLSSSTPSTYTWVLNNGALKSNVSNVAINGNVGAKCQNVMIYPQSEEAFNAVFARYNVMVELGTTASDYEPYTGRSITINLGQTVYGGKLDVLSGVLMVDMAMVDLGTLNWSRHGSVNTIFSSVIVGMKLPQVFTERNAGIISSEYAADSQFSISDSMHNMTMLRYNNNGSATLFIRDMRYTDGNDFKAAVSGVQLCYELAEPIEIQLTPHEVNSLLGINNIFADTGDTEVIYRADTKAYIAKKIAEAISALS